VLSAERRLQTTDQERKEKIIPAWNLELETWNLKRAQSAPVLALFPAS
jgi:hypothetical protein